MSQNRLYLSAPHLAGNEIAYIKEAFDENWVAPLGPHVDAFEVEFATRVGAEAAAATSSGTAALHLALILLGVSADDLVVCSSLTFAASVNPIRYLGASPVFIDSEETSWNMDPVLLAEALESMAAAGRLPKCVIVVHIYGQSADMDTILSICGQYNVPVIEDAAEALGATYKGHSPGIHGKYGIFSFNGNKIITTSGGGMLVSDDFAAVERARMLASQARDPAPHYEHSEIGYNYRLSNVLAGIGRAQLAVLEDRVAARRRNFEYYVSALGELPGVEFMPEAPWGRHSRWLTVLTIDPAKLGVDRDHIRVSLEAENIEARPVWKPMHLQPVFRHHDMVGGAISEHLFERGLCLPSGSSMHETDLERVVEVIKRNVLA